MNEALFWWVSSQPFLWAVWSFCGGLSGWKKPPDSNALRLFVGVVALPSFLVVAVYTIIHSISFTVGVWIRALFFKEEERPKCGHWDDP